MIHWNLLGMEPSKDTAAIKKAYRRALTETNPEDKPEEFMALREAYEAAMAYAGTPEEDAAGTESESASSGDGASLLEKNLLPESHPAFSWTRKLQALYRDFPRRIQEENWADLAADPICTRVDTAADCEEVLLNFLMEWWFVPDAAIRALNEVFAFDENRERLLTQYPPAFVDAILLTPLTRSTGMEYQYYQGAPDADYDGFINLYYTLTGHVNQGEDDAAWHCITAMEELDIYHPYLNMEKAKLYLYAGQPDLAAAEMEAVWPAFRTSPSICCMAGEVLLAQEKFEDAADRFSQALQHAPGFLWASFGMAEAALGRKAYDEAETRIDDLLAANRYSSRAKALEEELHDALLEDFNEKLNCGSLTEKEKIRLAVILIDKGEFEPAETLLAHFTSTDRRLEAQRLHYLATALLDLEQYEASFEVYHQAEALQREILSVTSEAEKGRLEEGLCRTIVMKSIALENLDQHEEALASVINASIDYPRDSMVLCRRAELHYELKQYQDAIDAATNSLAIDGSFHLPYRIRANAYYELGYYNEAFRDCSECIEIYSGDIEAFFCKINILAEAGETEAALEELDLLEEQVQGTQLAFLRGKTLEAGNRLHEALRCYRNVLELSADKEREIFWPAEVRDTSGTYYRLYQLLLNLSTAEGNPEFRRDALKYLQDGVKRHPSDLQLLQELAGEFYSSSRHREAQRLYERLAELSPTASNYARLAGNELQMDRFTAASVHLETAQKLDPSLTYAEILLAALCMHTEVYDQALTHLDRAQSCAEKNEEIWYRILRDRAMILCRMGRLPEAAECYKENFLLYQQQEDMAAAIEIFRLAGRFEEAMMLGEDYLATHEAEDSLLVLEELKYAAMYVGACAEFARYSRLDTNLFTRNYQAGVSCMYLPEAARDALEYFHAAASAVPSSIDVHVNLAKLYLKQKDRRQAEACARRALDTIPENFADCGHNRSYYLARSAEALAVLGEFDEAMLRLNQALRGRRCDFCKYSGCIDAYCALVYICCLRGEEEKMREYLEAGLAVSPFDFDLANMPEHYMIKKRGFFR